MTPGVHVTEIALSRKALLSLAVLLLSLYPSSLAQTASTRPAAKADLVLINGTILTVDAKDFIAEALAIRAGKIIAVGSKQQILALAEYVDKMHAVCVCCGAPAHYSQRIAGGTQQLLVGDGESYEARCRHCYVPYEA